MRELKIVCPSKGRADHVLTKDYIVNLTIIVPYKEVDEYKKCNPELEVIGTPPDIKGIAATRQWILEQWDDVFMIDDDICDFRRNFTLTNKNEEAQITDPYLIESIIKRDWFIAQQIGAKTFGYPSYRQPMQYKCQKPFVHTGYLNNSHVGFIKDHGLEYDLGYGEAEDYYISCLAIYQHRYTFIDTMYSFFTKDNFLARGGCNDIRTIEMMKENTLKLRKAFGSVVKIKIPTSVKSKVHEGERTISFPF